MVRISIGFVDLILRGVYKFGTACDLLIVIALAAQAYGMNVVGVALT